MILIFAVLLGVMWLLGFAVFNVASFALHALLLLAVIGIIVHFVRGRSKG